MNTTLKCKKIIQTHPKIGDIDRYPEDHQCMYPAQKNGFCRRHCPEKEKEKFIIKTKDSILTIEKCMFFLIQNGYRIDKPNDT